MTEGKISLSMDNEENQLVNEDDGNNGNSENSSSQDDERMRLPKPILYLYRINGIVEALPMLATTAFVNDRIQIPVSFISAYYAVAFIPYSLKPLYALMAKLAGKKQHILLPVYLIMSALLTQRTAFLKEGQIVQCFIVAFFKGVFQSAAEFMVGLNLLLSASYSIDEWMMNSQEAEDTDEKFEQKRQRHEIILSCYQSQAATSRNAGSLLAHILTFLVIIWKDHSKHSDFAEDDDTSDRSNPLSDTFITGSFLITSIFPLLGVCITVKTQLGRHSYDSISFGNRFYQNNTDQGDCLQEVNMLGLIKYDLLALLLFQAALIWLGLRNVITGATSSMFFQSVILVICSGCTLAIYIAWKSYRSSRSNESCTVDDAKNTIVTKLQYIKRVAVYLILRHATPTSNVTLSSFLYTVFRSQPIFLQSLSLASSATTMLSSWTYGSHIAQKFAALKRVKSVIILTTMLCALWSLLFLPFITSFRKYLVDDTQSIGLPLKICYITFQLVASFLSELSFLPSVILSTTSTIDIDNVSVVNEASEGHDDVPIDTLPNSTLERNARNGSSSYLDHGMQYGILLACIDFGDQLSDFVTIPIIQALDIRRDNDWENIEWFVVICSMLSAFSILYLRIIRT